ncbi:hypothetical protein AB0H76_03005 [Nocardia sp. NPDC050712]|uniref:F0F1 ATP synthase subunit B family protein n=1 Tax=Nocardia sp. NPDC050712 TaxID=3155518 RepID=UPI00340A32F9
MFHIIWDWPIFLSQLFGFAVVVYVLVRSVAPRVRAAMDKAQNGIRGQLEDSEHAAIQVAAAAEAHEAALAQGAIAKTQLTEEANAAAAQILLDLRAEAEEAAERTARQGRARIRQLRRELVEQTQARVHTAVLDRTEHTVRTRVGTPQARSAGIDRFLDDLDEVGERARAC